MKRVSFLASSILFFTSWATKDDPTPDSIIEATNRPNKLHSRVATLIRDYAILTWVGERD